MNKLQELINEMCPDGVEYKKIEQVCTISRGRVMSKEYIRNNKGQYPVYSSQTENNGELGCINTYDFEGEYLTWTTDGANAGSVFYRNSKFSITNVCGLLKVSNNEVITKFLYYVLIIEAPKYVNKGMGNPKLMSNIMAKINIPIPPLEIQQEIVRILDTFTELTTELTTELDARKKQYEYYHNLLTDFRKREDVNWCSVGDYFTFKNGINKDKSCFGKGDYIVNFTDVYNYRALTRDILKGRVQTEEKDLTAYDARYGDIFFTRTSETKEDIGMVSALVDNIERCVFSGFVLRARPNTDNWLPKFCSYYFSSHQVRMEIVRYASFTTRALTSGPRLSKLQIPLISKDEQQRIVNILDRFDSLCNDITKGIPAEIEARRKQYEYYRDKLLTFKELKKEGV